MLREIPGKGQWGRTWDDSLRPVEAEPLGGVVLVAQEALEGVGVRQALEDVDLLLLQSMGSGEGNVSIPIYQKGVCNSNKLWLGI
jgi:hypothetical protein